MVAEHVQGSAKTVEPVEKKCMVEQVPLLFVYGPDQSLPHFIEVSRNNIFISKFIWVSFMA